MVACMRALAQEPPVLHERSELVLTPRLIVKPEFPKEARELRQSGQVDIEAVIGPDGRARSWKLRPGNEASRIFVAEVEDVIRHWRWNPQVGTDCMPAQAEIKTSVWFEWEGDEPKVFIQRTTKGQVPPAAVSGPKPKHVKRVTPQYPRSMIRSGIHADVYALAQVSAEGDVQSVGAIAYPVKGDANLAPFEKSVEAAIAQWKFEPRPEGPWRYCTSVSFRIKD
jgi:outer membrane biosynthesis protein TonB